MTTMVVGNRKLTFCVVVAVANQNQQSNQQQLSKNSIMDYLNSKIQLFLEIELLDLFYWLLLLQLLLPPSTSMVSDADAAAAAFSQSIRRME